MKLTEPTLFLRDGKEWIKGFTMERPERAFAAGSITEEMADRYFHNDMIDFNNSAVEYPVHPESKLPIKAFIKGLTGEMAKSENQYRIDGLADRLDIDGEYGYDEYGPIDTRTIRLKPEAKEGELLADEEDEFYVRFGNKMDAELYDEIFEYIEKRYINKLK